MLRYNSNKISCAIITCIFAFTNANAAEDIQAVPPERINILVTYGEEECPKPIGDEIVVCAQKPESERYRIPEELREDKEIKAEQSWSSSVSTLDESARTERPGSCSVVGSNGFSGCQAAALRQWFNERQEARE